jgi:hypothetical protein
MKRGTITVVVGLAGVAGIVGSAFAAVDRGKRDCLLYGAVVYHGQSISPQELCRLQEAGRAQVAQVSGTRGETLVFDTEAELDVFERPVLVASLKRAHERHVPAVRRCFGPLVDGQRGPVAKMHIAGRSVHIWPRPTPVLDRHGIGTHPPSWARKFEDPRAATPRIHGAMRFAVWSWAQRPTDAQDAALRARIPNCEAITRQ